MRRIIRFRTKAIYFRDSDGRNPEKEAKRTELASLFTLIVFAVRLAAIVTHSTPSAEERTHRGSA